MEKYLVIDVGGTNIKYALMDENARMLEKGETATPKTEKEEFLQILRDLVGKYEKKEIKALCFSAPGRIDSKTGYFHTGGALTYLSGMNLAEEVKKFCDLDTAVENDAKAAALAELWKGELQDADSGMCLILGTGIGGALVMNHRLVRGNHFAAGEVSGISADWSQPYDPLKAWVRVNSTNALLARYEKEKGLSERSVNGRDFFEALNKGDETAKVILDDYCIRLASAIVSLQLILDVERFCIGGGISAQPVLLSTLKEKVHALFEEGKGKLPAVEPDVRVCRYGNDANLIGALYHYLYEIKA